MERELATRREVLRVGMIGSAMLVSGCSGSTAPGSTSSTLSVVAAAPARATQVVTLTLGAGELAYWQGLVGQSFSVTGPEGPMQAVLSGANAIPVVGDRPAELRVQPMTLTFSFDAREKPQGEALYTVAHARDAASLLFMSLGNDASGKATLSAILN